MAAPALDRPMSPADVTYALKRLGWRIRSDAERERAVRDFQRAWRLGPPLAIDGKVGKNTRTALRTSLLRQDKKLPDASDHFSFRQLACKCRGRYSDCPRIRCHRFLLDGLEDAWAKHGPFELLSVFRCTRHNKAVGGGSSSQHLYGAAADVRWKLNRAKTAALRAFAGIGWARSSGLVQHVDVRHVSGNNTTAGTPDRPTTWVYGR